MCRLIANSKMSTYKCPKCETEFSLGTKFCEKCSCNLNAEFIETPTCPKCKKTFPTGTVFCNEHGVKLVSPEQLIPRCGKCEKQYTDGTKYCPDCGGSVDVSVFLTNRNLASAKDFVQTGASNLVGILVMFVGIVGIILLSGLDWVYYSEPLGGQQWVTRKASPLVLSNLVSPSLSGSIIPLLSMFSLIVSFVLLIISLLMHPRLKAKSILAYSGFGLCAFVAAIFILVVLISKYSLTVFPFLTLVVAILGMAFVVKRPTKKI